MRAGEQQRVRDAGVVHLQREEVDVGVRGRGGDDVLALSGADFDDQRIGVAPGHGDGVAVEREVVAHVQRPLAVVDVQQIRVGVVVPRALQPRVQTAGSPHERQYRTRGESRLFDLLWHGFLVSGRSWYVPYYPGAVDLLRGRRASMGRLACHLCMVWNVGNVSMNIFCSLMFMCYDKTVRKNNKSEHNQTFNYR